MFIASLFACEFVGAVIACGQELKPFQIRIVDEETGRGVPLVEFKTVHNQTFISDSAGRIAIREPELMGQNTFFHITSHGYEFPKDGFGYRGRTTNVVPGEKTEFKIKRLNVAERLYRITGQGIYSDSILLGEPVPTSHPLSNAFVSGSDSVVTAVYRNKLYWFWGDTNFLKYPLGNFQVTGATSLLPIHGGMPPSMGVDLEYFKTQEIDKNTDSNRLGFAKPMAPLPGDGPTWIFGLAVLKDESGQEHLLTGYEKVKPPLDVYERGIAEFNDERREFMLRKRFDKDVPLYPHNHPFRHRTEGVDYLYWGDTYPVVRVRATIEDFLNLSHYEGFTCLTQGTVASEMKVERDSSGRIVIGWKKNTAPMTLDLQTKLLNAGAIKPEEAYWKMIDVETGKEIRPHRVCVAWNEYRKRWTMIFTQIHGTSVLGEVFYTESDSPEGPWSHARKVVTHNKYSFYNPRQHSYFAEELGRYIYFEGTYTEMFSGNSNPTPRYDYNQIMYRLDVDSPQLQKLRVSHKN